MYPIAAQKPRIPASGRGKTSHTATKTLNSGVARVFYDARYLDPKTSRWISADPAMGEYIPQAPINDEAKKRNGNLPGMGGVFNYVNFHVYHYAGNNPIKLVDPDGRDDENQLTSAEMDILFWRSKEFDTMDEAAIDFAMNYNDDSIMMNREIGATIKKTEDGKFYYDVPRIGTESTSVSYYGGSIVANIHTHGGEGEGTQYLPSPKDFSNVIKRKTTSYVVNPLGDIMRLDPESNDPNGFTFTPLDVFAPNLNTSKNGVFNFKVSQVEYDRIVNKYLSSRRKN